ncbi:uncharacterized protein MELLADRAFT_45973 [Melampsora larici-populina 98AG31]|uniref:RRM domain-containing protein n=1 Tax=Melampsora larici-populina (strain 98AG31 / pathotype 3-4-7) TaxID=747676 RepID=F4S9M0_MELLP|nr:uncharacterized protein MELLADRAFT_45973 [Melampsora larici-populina 98AG31]EGF98676.1 hypothetical protein MELLADRAFT_45973 [Melampsora larici-populina 98AG31]
MSKTKTETKKADKSAGRKKPSKSASPNNSNNKKLKEHEAAEPASDIKAPTGSKPDVSSEVSSSKSKSTKPVKSALKKSDSHTEKLPNSLKKKSSKVQIKESSEFASISKETKPSTPKTKSTKSPVRVEQQVTEDLEDASLLTGFEIESAEGDDDSSDDDDDEESLPETSAFDLKDLPKASKRQKSCGKGDDASIDNTGVVYLGRIPHGFHEEEMKGYFSQFGEIRRVRLSRNRRTGKSKHYGFIEFKHKEVAEIVAETLHNYLLCGNMLQCQLLEKDEIHPRLWLGNNRKFRKDWKPRVAREKHNQPKSEEQQRVITDRLIERETLKRKRLETLGISYDYPGYCSSKDSSKPAKSIDKPEASATKTTTSTQDSSDKSKTEGVETISMPKSKNQPKKKKARKST